MPKNCPICGDLLEDGYCLNCGYDAYVDDFPSNTEERSSKKDGSLIDDLLDILSDEDN